MLSQAATADWRTTRHLQCTCVTPRCCHGAPNEAVAACKQGRGGGGRVASGTGNATRRENGGCSAGQQQAAGGAHLAHENPTHIQIPSPLIVPLPPGGALQLASVCKVEAATPRSAPPYALSPGRHPRPSSGMPLCSGSSPGSEGREQGGTVSTRRELSYSRSAIEFNSRTSGSSRAAAAAAAAAGRRRLRLSMMRRRRLPLQHLRPLHHHRWAG